MTTLPYPSLSTSPPLLLPPSSPLPPPFLSYDVTMFQAGETALMEAAEEGKLSCLELLVEKGADLNAKNRVRDECGGHV